VAYDQVPAHDDDINSVAFADETSQVFFTGSDDMLCKVWDRRSASESGVLVGHLSGITHVSSKGDGRYLITNSKDQSIKLWDIRRMSNSVRATLSFFSSYSRPSQPQPINSRRSLSRCGCIELAGTTKGAALRLPLRRSPLHSEAAAARLLGQAAASAGLVAHDLSRSQYLPGPSAPRRSRPMLQVTDDRWHRPWFEATFLLHTRPGSDTSTLVPRMATCTVR